MKRLLHASLPYQAAWVVPALPLAVLYGLDGRSPLWGLVGGLLGLLGALLAALVQLWQAARDEVEQAWRTTPRITINPAPGIRLRNVKPASAQPPETPKHE